MVSRGDVSILDRLRKHNKSWAPSTSQDRRQTVSVQPTEEISMIACHFPDRPLMIFFPFKGKTYAMQIKLLQAEPQMHAE